MSIAIDPSTFASAIAEAKESSALLTLRDTVAEIARTAEAPFVAAGAMLMDVVETLDAIIAELEAVSGAIDAQAASASVADLQRVADRLMSLPDAHAARALRMRSVADAAKDLATHVTTAGRTLRILDIFGMNLSVASEGEPEFAGFAQHMAQKLGEGERHLSGMTARLAGLVKGVAGMRDADHQLSRESAQVIPHVPNRLIRDAMALGDHLAASAIAAGQVAATARRVRDQIAVMLGAMQVGDRTRQRLEHAAAGLAMADTYHNHGGGAAAVAHLQRLLIAQIEATATDFDRDALLLADAFGALQPEARALIVLMEDGARTGGAGSIRELETGIGDVKRLTERLCAADDRARAMHHLIAGAITDLSQRLDGVRQLRSNVQVIATNIAVLCRRHGQIGRGVSAIADQIDIEAGVLPQVADDIARPIDTLLTVSDAMTEEYETKNALDVSAILSGAMAILREGARRSAAATDKRSGDRGQRLFERIGSAADRIAAERALAARIRDCATQLSSCTSDDAEPDDDGMARLAPVLQDLAGLYTMAQERDIHARFVPEGPPVSVEPTPDDDDDGLF